MGAAAQRQASFALSFTCAIFLTHQIVTNLSFLDTTITPEVYLNRTALALAGFLFPVLGGWVAFRLIGGVAFALYAAAMVFFVVSVSSTPALIWFLVSYAALGYGLYGLDQHYENQSAAVTVDREKYQNEKNDLEVSYKTKGEAISVLFEKYSTYYNLRKLAEELSTSLSVAQLAQMVVDRTFDFIPRGDAVLLTLSHVEGPTLPIVAMRRAIRIKEHPTATRPPEGDFFDLWVVKNCRRLIVTDAHQDFRFDLKETMRQGGPRGVIIAPLLNEGRVMGTLRINASGPGVFTNDDLRLLDTIAVLASSAIANAVLYERTEELAIKDSLTGLYVRRYFFDRLKDEHRRALLTQRPLSLLMCDLDCFKECNDRLGHGVGDLVLNHVAHLLTQTVENGVVARYGGEEFVVLLPEHSKEQAKALAEKIRQTVEKNPFLLRREKIPVTLSLGVASLPQDTLDLETFVQKADQALYHAKRSGRNRVCSEVTAS